MMGIHSEASLEFTLEDEIGHEGNNSQVFLSTDPQLGSRIVVKRIPRGDFEDANVKAHFAEARKLYASTHRNVARVLYGCRSINDEYIYIAMPYYKGGSLGMARKRRALSVREIVRYSIQFLTGLHHIHSKGLIHFDVKPSNVLIDDYGEAVLADFGISEATNDAGTVKEHAVYNRHLPPERLRSEPSSVAYDIYSVGLTLYRLCNGDDFYIRQMTFRSMAEYSQAILSESYPDRNKYLPHIPKRMRLIIKKCLRALVADRYADVQELLNALAQIHVNVDWQYGVDIEGEKWEKRQEGVSIIITLLALGKGAYEVITTKTASSGIARKVQAQCSRHSSKQDALKAVELACAELG